MIRVVKPAEAPEVLRGRGVEKKYQHCNDHDNGQIHFDFDSKIYNGPTVKETLLQAQHGKCCYCESKTPHVAFGDVEHFRPKGGHQQRPDSLLGTPGYYWLAYEWENLFMACQVCNQKFKKNLFPLRRPTRRARSHHDDLGREEPLLIDPAAVDPARHIAFREEYPRAVRNSLIGRTTIDVFGLNRPDLVERRREQLAKITLAIKTRGALANIITDGDAAPELRTLLDQIDTQLAQCVLDSAEYAAMARAALAGGRSG